MSKTKLAATLASFVSIARPVLAHAQTSSDIGYSTSRDSVSSGSAGVIILVFIAMLVIIIGFFIFWLLMLIDALKRTKWENESDRMLWIITLSVSIVFGLSWLVAIVYYVVVKKKLDKKKSRKK